MASTSGRGQTYTLDTQGGTGNCLPVCEAQEVQGESLANSQVGEAVGQRARTAARKGRGPPLAARAARHLSAPYRSLIHPARPGAKVCLRRLGIFGRYAGREVAEFIPPVGGTRHGR
jgi:hypothetical protein